MNNKFRIGELAKMFNISNDTLRLYDKRKLLQADYQEDNKYRYYDISSMFKLSRILFLKNLDISLADIDNYMKNKNAHHLNTMLKKKNDELEERIQQLTNLKQKINSKIDLFDHAKTQLGRISLKRLKSRQGIYIKTYGLQGPNAAKEAFVESNHYLKMSSWLIEGEVSTSLTKEDMDKGIFDQFSYFIEVHGHDLDQDQHLVTLPEEVYACMTVIGPYEDLANHYKVLVDWINERGYTISGNSIENNIVDGDYSNSSAEFITELQIPIHQ